MVRKYNNANNHACYYFDDKIKFEDFDLDNILMDEKPFENIFVYDILYKTLIGAKPFRIWLDKVDGFVRVYNGTRCLVLFSDEKYVFISNRITYLIGVKSSLPYVFFYNDVKMKVHSYDSLPLKKTLTFHNVTSFIKSVFNKDCNKCLAKGSYQLPKNNDNK